MNRRLFSMLAGAAVAVLLIGSTGVAADAPETAGAKATREKKLKAKLTLDIEKKMLRAIINEDLPSAVKEATNLTLKIQSDPKGITLTSSFGPFKGDMTLEEVLNKICDDRGWGWYVVSTKVGDQKDGSIMLTTNPKERGYKEGTGPKTEPKKK